MQSSPTKVAIGFATGRKSFKKVLATYIYNMLECGLIDNGNLRLDLFVAYDLRYNNTKSVDYTNINKDLKDMIGNVHFLGETFIRSEIHSLCEKNVITKEEASLIFESGYAGKRNLVLYEAIKNSMDCLLFLDDDEYPLAVTNSKGTAIWSGQAVLSTHLEHIKGADITNGLHCGYISPIPCLKYNDTLPESSFQQFIEAISNDIITWDKIRAIMKNKGVTYADTDILVKNEAREVIEEGGAKFISGANLCINLKNKDRVKPFYNPPGARGEDTFLSTILSDSKVLRVPTYTFHDGFSTYNCLLHGVLPTRLEGVTLNSDQTINRFYRASIGWVRYKPLFTYITDREHYEEKIAEMENNLLKTLPQICRYFKTMSFMRILPELEIYHRNVKAHYDQFLKVQSIWKRLLDNM